MNTRSVILQKAVELISASSTGEISTRAVCEAAGIGQPVLYRHFGDKDGLMAAVADHVWNQYLDSKRAAESSGDPLIDLIHGWDAHTDFALEHPHAYRLVFASTLSSPPKAASEAFELLEEILARLARQGRLLLEPRAAAKVVMAANSGVALSLILRPDQYTDRSISTAVRDATIRGLIRTDAVDASEAVSAAATTLSATAEDSHLFSAAEASLLVEWLQRFHTN